MLKSVTDYQTNKIAIIRNTWIVYFHRLFQLGIIVYVIGYSLWYQKGYQDSYGLSSSVIVKVKGIGISNRTKIHRKIWDIIDTVVPPQENNAFFITTNVIETADQRQGVCAENPTVKHAICKKDSDCQKDEILYLGNGVMTGRCIPINSLNKTCEIQAWCPIENDEVDFANNPLLSEVPNYTALIKNAIIFNEINVQRSNLFAYTSELLPTTCVYNGSDANFKYCPIFKISSIFGKIDETDLMELLTYGGIFRIIITWNCNLDWSYDFCRPEYSFERLYTKFGKFSKGYNFRYANYYELSHKEYRILYKVFGIRILIETRGKAQKFSVFTLSMSIGSGLALLTIATLVCDVFITSVMPQKKKYRKMLYEIHSISKNTKTKENIRDIPLIEEKLDK